MNNIASLEDFLNQASGVGSTLPLPNIQRQINTPSIGSQRPVVLSQNKSNQKNTTDIVQEEFNDISINQYIASVTSDAINDHSNEKLATNSNFQHEHLRKELLLFCSKSLQEIKQEIKKSVSQQNQRLNTVEQRVASVKRAKQTAADNEQCVTKKDLDALRTDLLNVFSRSVEGMKKDNKTEFAEHKKQLNDLKSNQGQTKQKQNQSDQLSSEFSKINKKVNEKLNSQYEVVQAIKAKLDDLNEKYNYQHNKINSLQSQLEKEKKKRITLTERFGKNITELNLLKQQIPLNEKPLLDLFSDNESTFSMSSNNSEQHKSIATNAFSLRETKVLISQSPPKMSKDIITKDLEDNELSNNFSTAPGIMLGEITKKVTNDLLDAFATASEIKTSEITEDFSNSNKLLDTNFQAPGMQTPTPRRLSSASDSVTSLASNESDNDQFDSYLDKAQLYLQQMTISSSDLSLHVADKSLSNVLSDEGMISSSLLNEETSKQVVKEIERLSPKPLVNTDKDKEYGNLRLRLSVQKDSGKNEKEYVTQPFLTGKRGYKVQVNAIVRLSQVDVYFLVRVYKGKYDCNISWPFNQRFCVKLSSKTESKKQIEWYIPSLDRKWKKNVKKPVDNKPAVYTEFIGPFDIKDFLDLDELCLDVNPI